MKGDKLRTLSYRRATWFSGVPSDTLENLLRAALKKFTTVSATKIVRADGGTLKIMHRRSRVNQPVFVHISLHTPGESASTLPTADAVVECDLDTAPAPTGREYLDGDTMVMVSGNDVILCVSNMHEASTANYLRDFVLLSKQAKHDHSFDLLKIANKEILEELCSAGVKKITLDVHAFEQSLKVVGGDAGASEARAASRGIRNFFRALTQADKAADDLADRADIQAAVSIRADLRRHGGADIAAAAAAKGVLDMFDSGYEIETTSGIKITPDEITVRRRFSFPAHGKTVQYTAVWDQMARFYNTLVADGLNAQ